MQFYIQLQCHFLFNWRVILYLISMYTQLDCNFKFNCNVYWILRLLAGGFACFGRWLSSTFLRSIYYWMDHFATLMPALLLHILYNFRLESSFPSLFTITIDSRFISFLILIYRKRNILELFFFFILIYRKRTILESYFSFLNQDYFIYLFYIIVLVSDFIWLCLKYFICWDNCY